MDVSDVKRVRDAFERADFTSGAVSKLLGPVAHRALGGGESVPAERATRGGSPVETLIRLFLLGHPVSYADAARALPVEQPFTERDGDEVRALVHVRPCGEGWWVVSDLATSIPRSAVRCPRRHDEVTGVSSSASPPSAVRCPRHYDDVMGMSSSSLELAQLTVRPSVESALDLGTGSGFQSLLLAEHAESVTATDLNPRALSMARLTLALSGADAELVEGYLFEPVAGRRFDLIVSNPPYLVSPVVRFLYDNSGLPGDELCRRIVSGAAAHLAAGGWCQLIAQWVHVRGESWEERVAGWVPPGCDAWVLQRTADDPAEHVRFWLASVFAEDRAQYVPLYNEWLDAFDRDGVEGVGSGWVTLRASGAADPVIRIGDHPHELARPTSPWIHAWFARQDWLRSRAPDGDSLLAATLVPAGGVLQERSGWPRLNTAERIFLREQGGVGRRVEVDAVTSCLVAGCDGTLPVGALVDAVAPVVRRPPGELRRDYLPVIRSLVADGLLVPADPVWPAAPGGEPRGSHAGHPATQA